MKLTTLTSATISILRAQTTINFTFLYPVAVHVDVGLVEPSPVVNISWVCPTVCPGERGLVERAGQYEEPHGEPHGEPALHLVPHRHNWGAQSELPSSSLPHHPSHSIITQCQSHSLPSLVALTLHCHILATRELLTDFQ